MSSATVDSGDQISIENTVLIETLFVSYYLQIIIIKDPYKLCTHHAANQSYNDCQKVLENCQWFDLRYIKRSSLVTEVHMWHIFSSRMYVFLISSLPFDCI